MNLNIFPVIDDLNAALAQHIIEVANQAIRTNDRFNFVLTGGSSPKALYRLLATLYKDKIDWTKVYFFFGDERNVQPGHKDYNGQMAKENLFDLLQTPEDHIFYFDTTRTPEAAAADYNERLLHHFGTEEIRFDLVLLGMGDDAHTASIFPQTDLVDAEVASVKVVWVEKLNSFRLSFTAPLINQARYVSFITYGQNKAQALQQVLQNNVSNSNLYPAQLIKPRNGKLDWFVDEAAASLLKV